MIILLVCTRLSSELTGAVHLTISYLLSSNLTRQAYNPWAPDSRSFVYVTSAGMFHTPLMGSKHCLGEDAWHNQGATFGTWSRQ
jgi:hypothetical protein